MKEQLAFLVHRDGLNLKETFYDHELNDEEGEVLGWNRAAVSILNTSNKFLQSFGQSLEVIFYISLPLFFVTIRYAENIRYTEM